MRACGFGSTTGRTARWQLLLVVVALSACTRPRAPDGDDARSCINWQDDVEARVQSSCASCHSGATPGGSYDVTTYHGVLGGGTDDVANAIAGDNESRLLTRLRNQGGIDNPHRDFGALEALLTEWVVNCRIGYFDSSIHAPGIQNPADREQFHGGVLESRGYDFAVCTQCHGEDFAGGASEVSCLRCHQGGPTTCVTCHTATMKKGAHAIHVQGGPLQQPLGCEECHRKPTSYTDVGHIYLADGTPDPRPAEVNFGPRANHTPLRSDREGPPTWNPQTNTCSNMYCHAQTWEDSNAALPNPTWTPTRSTAGVCVRCHGTPPSEHPQTNACARCHIGVVDSSGNIINRGEHIDGKVSIGTGTCNLCHSDATDYQPWRGLGGETSPESLAVGLHVTHLSGPHGLSGAFSCNECHLVPANAVDPGHVDTDLPAEVFPPETQGGRAWARGATPAWDRTTATCSNVGCHGGTGDTQGNTVSWLDQSNAAIACGTCHGVPPDDETHRVPADAGRLQWQLSDCATCHPSTTIDEFGNVQVMGTGSQRTSTHMDGIVQVRGGGDGD